MTAQEIEEFLTRSLDDHRLSRGEKQVLGDIAGELGDDQREAIRRRAFAIARAAMGGPEDGNVLDWLEEVVKIIQRRPEPTADTDQVEALFSPGDACVRRIVQLFARARRGVDVCVFTITDDRITASILDAHRRQVPLRIITDNEKAFDEGSDITRLSQAGIPVRVDQSLYHMHHKFAIFDDASLLTGSYNWTRGAAENNEENFVVVGDRRLVDAFAATFERLWFRLGIGGGRSTGSP